MPNKKKPDENSKVLQSETEEILYQSHDEEEKNLSKTVNYERFEDEYSPHQPQFDLCATLYKRRGGLGRNAGNNWLQRFFTLKGSVLCYYESSEVEKADPSKPRGRIDLASEAIIAEMHNMHKPGAPTSFLLTVNIYVLGSKRKWEMCCTDKIQQEQWYKALKRFDGKPVDSVHSNSNHPNSPHQSKRKTTSNPTQSTLNSSISLKHPPQQIARDSSHSSHNFVDESIRADFHSDLSFLHYLSQSDYLLCVSVLNILIYVIRTGSTEICAIIVVLSNMILLQYQRKRRFYSQGLTASQSWPTLPVKADDSIPATALPIQDTMTAATTFKRATPTGPTAQALKEKETDPDALIEAYSNPKATYDKTGNTYWNVDSSIFNLRVGPNYKKLKNKEPSGPALYNLYAMDLVSANNIIRNVESFFDLPKVKGFESWSPDSPLPPMIVVHCSLPTEEPSMLGSPVDGPSVIAVFYLVISPQAQKEAKDIKTASPSVKLLADWIKKAPTDDVFRGRFKVICIIDDIEEIGLPSMISSYNGKPVLINKSGSFKRHENYIETAVNVHNFSYISKKCLYSIHGKFSSFVFNVGFTIEGRDDDELPEVLLGGGRIMNLDLNNLVKFGESI